MQELEAIQSMHPDEYHHVNVLRTRFERQVQQEIIEPTEEENAKTQHQRIDELLQRKAQIIARKIDSDTAARGAINEMQMINVTLVHLKGKFFHIIMFFSFSCRRRTQSSTRTRMAANLCHAQPLTYVHGKDQRVK